MTRSTTGFSGPLPPARFNMAEYCIGRAAASHGDKIALLVVDRLGAAAPAEMWTYRQLDAAVRGVAAGLLAQGFVRGDRLLIRLENTSAYALLFFGAVAAGLVPIPASSQLTPEEVAFFLENSGARGVALAHGMAADRLPQGVRALSADAVADLIANVAPAAGYADTAANDPAYMIYTSGTTAKPKGVLHAQRSAWGRRPMYEGWYGLGADDRMLHAGAFNWTYTLGVGLTDPWACGATSIVYTGDKSPETWPTLIAETQASIFAAVPSLYRQILKYAAPTRASLGRLRHGLIAGEPPPPTLFEEWYAATGTHLYEAFGMSEMSTYISSSPTRPRRPGTIGRAQPGRCIAILPAEAGTEPLPPGQEGLVAVHRTDPGLMLGYWQRPDEDAEVRRGDWFIGGDLGVMDADGYISHRGRANDIMKALGYRVAPQEVEAVLSRVPGVAEVACAEVRVRDDVTVIGAFIVAAAGHPQSKDTILAYAREHLAAYKLPREIVFVATLPRTANGKLKRKDLALPKQPSVSV
jgi:acyl-coenzyme A synthetase/AMP-(fatty) acid ligase